LSLGAKGGGEGKGAPVIGRNKEKGEGGNASVARKKGKQDPSVAEHEVGAQKRENPTNWAGGGEKKKKGGEKLKQEEKKVCPSLPDQGGERKRRSLQKLFRTKIGVLLSISVQRGVREGNR